MTTRLFEFPPLTKGLYIPDASAEMPAGSLGIATDCDLTKSGTIKQRYGSAKSASIVGHQGYSFIHDNAGTPQMVTAGGAVYGGNGTTITEESVVTGHDCSGSAQMLRSALSTANPNTYVGSSTSVLYRWDGSSFTSVPSSPKARYVVQAGWAERLLYCGLDAGATNGPNGTPVDKSIVGVSNPSEPEVYTTTDTTSISPGDGEDVMGCVTYNGQTFVFKETSFFVFYGEDDSGSAVELLYNQRSGVGMVAPGNVTVGPDGVYFLAADGIYRTTGGAATCISTQINGLFTGELPSWTPYNRNLPSPDTAFQKFATSGDKMYFAVSSTQVNDAGDYGSNIILVYDTTTQAWVGYYNFPVLSLHAMPWPDLSQPLIVGLVPVDYDTPSAFGTCAAFVFHPLLAGDFGENNPVPMAAQLNWFQSPDAKGYAGIDEAAIHRLDLWGSGTFDVATVINFDSTAQTSKQVQFGDLPPSQADVWGDGSGTTAANNILTLNQSAITASTDGDDLSVSTVLAPAAPTVVPTAIFGGTHAVSLTTIFLDPPKSLMTYSTASTNAPSVVAGYYYEASAEVGDAPAYTPPFTVSASARMDIYWFDSAMSAFSTTTGSSTDILDLVGTTRVSTGAVAPVGAAYAVAFFVFSAGLTGSCKVAKIQLRQGNDPAAYVNGYVSPGTSDDFWLDSTTDVWGTGTGSETDLIRLYPPVHKYVFAPKGRGNYLALRFTKTTGSGYAYLNAPRATLQSR